MQQEQNLRTSKSLLRSIQARTGASLEVISINSTKPLYAYAQQYDRGTRFG
uniref:Uncharacterized protein n=1 Tax=Nelumbo nucifera TaxID=4432 RepID=A0A822XIG2_NELNU|nr:TPA_asm: hypothetical protein HUJ06_021480 [Nelumbo nucifera]